MVVKMINLRDLYLEEIENELVNLGEKKYRAKQIFAWLYRGVDSFDEMTDLSKDLIQKLKENYEIKYVRVGKFQKSKDGTIKYAVKPKPKPSPSPSPSPSGEEDTE